MTAGPSLRLELLGAPRLLRSGIEVRISVRKSLAMLAYVAVERRATRAKLAALFWAGGDADAARRNLRRELHRLRETGVADALLADDDAVAVAPGLDCDVHAFVAALEAGRHADALSLYRGPLMDGFDLADGGAFDEWLGQSRDLMARRFADAARRHAEDRERAGDARGALDALGRLIAHEPLQESHHAQAMRLHYLIGERAAALDLYERLRQSLRRELDLEPLPETAALAERIRAAERVAPLLARAGGPGLARFEGSLVGRSQELAQLARAAAPVVLIEGEAGVGKTRLATEFALERTPLLRMTGRELAREASLHPFAELLRQAQQDPALRERLRSLPAEARAEVGRLVPGLAPATAASAGSGPSARGRFFAALADTLAALSADGVLLVDDLHWLDDGTAEVLEGLAQRLPAATGSCARVVCTARSAELADARPIAERVRRLERAGLLVRLPLGPLSEAATLALVRELSGSSGGERFAGRLQRVTRGNPYFVLETLRFLFDAGELQIAEDGQWATRYDADPGDYRELPVPPSVQQAVVERVERLGPAARRVLETAALAGEPFTLDEVQPATALGEWDALEGLERALQAQLVLPADGGGYRYAHDLARGALDAALRPERRRLIHLKLAESLEARRGPAQRIAVHLEAAGRAAQAVPYRIAAARTAEAVFAWREALAHYGAALAAASAEQRADLHRARLALLRTLFDLDGLASEADAMEALAGSLPTLALEAEIARIDVANLRKRHDEARRRAEAVRADPRWPDLPAAQRLKATREYATALSESGQAAPAAALYRELLDGHFALSTVEEGGIQYGLAMALWRLFRPAEAEDALRRAEALFTDAGAIEMRARVYNLLAHFEHQAGRTEQSIGTLERALADAERGALITVQKSVLLNLIKLHVGRNEPERAAALLQRATEVLASTDDLAARALLASRESEVRRAQGRLGEALDAAQHAIALFEDNGGGSADLWPWFQLAHLLWRLGDSDGARAVYRGLRESPASIAQAAALVAFYDLVLRLPATPADVLAGLDAIEPTVCDVAVERGEFAYYRALALLETGAADAAWSLLEPLRATAFTLHEADVAALRLNCALRRERDVAHWEAAAAALLPTAPPLEALGLREALARAAAQGRDAARARAHRDAAAALALTLAESLDRRPALRSAFTRRHADLLEPALAVNTP